MATGLGKTHLASFDSIPFEKILFVAHVKEILDQAENTFHDVRRFGSTVQLSEGVDKILKSDVVFATVQKLSRKNILEKIPRGHFDYIIIDEFHHSAAKSYKKVIEYFDPKFLLGLTATPFRMDRKDISQFCGSNIPFVCNMPEAINNKWLSPFKYFGIYDTTIDYDDIKWAKGKYNDKELTLAVNNKERARVIFDKYVDR